MVLESQMLASGLLRTVLWPEHARLQAYPTTSRRYSPGKHYQLSPYFLVNRRSYPGAIADAMTNHYSKPSRLVGPIAALGRERARPYQLPANRPLSHRILRSSTLIQRRHGLPARLTLQGQEETQAPTNRKQMRTRWNGGQSRCGEA